MPPDDPEREKGKAKDAFDRSPADPQKDSAKPPAVPSFVPRPDGNLRQLGDNLARREAAREALRQKGDRLKTPEQATPSKEQQIAATQKAAAERHAVQRRAQARTHEQERQEKQRQLAEKYGPQLEKIQTERNTVEDRIAKTREAGGRTDDDRRLLAALLYAAATARQEQADEWRRFLANQADERDKLNEQLQAELDAQLHQIDQQHERVQERHPATEAQITAWVKTLQAETIERQRQEAQQLDQQLEKNSKQKEQALTEKYGPQTDRLREELQAIEDRQAARGAKAIFNRLSGRAGQDAQRSQQIGFELSRIDHAHADERSRFAESQEAARQDLVQQHEAELMKQEVMIEKAYITGHIPGHEHGLERERDRSRDGGGR